MTDLVDEAFGHIDDCCGEGIIALPELTDSVSQSAHVSEKAATIAAQAALTKYFDAGKIRVHLGRWDSDDPQEIRDHEATAVLADISRYTYGDGDEVRAWFSLDC